MSPVICEVEMGLLDRWRGRAAVRKAQDDLALKRAQLQLKTLDAQEHWTSYFGTPSDPGVGFEGAFYLDSSVSGLFSLDDVGLTEMRRVGRWLAFNNGFAKSFLRNMQNFVVGKGGMTTSFDAPQDPPPEFAGIDDATWEELADEARRAFREFEKANRWGPLQREAVANAHRDGDYFLRIFMDAFGNTTVRAVDPSEIGPDQENRWPDGIITDPVDKQLVLAYLVNKQQVPADQMIHIKVNTDSNVLRGLPTLWCPREKLIRADKILRNMGKVTEVQAAIAAIRTHEVPIGSTDMETWLDAAADKTTKNDIDTGNPIRQSKIHPGSVIDLQKGDQMQFPVGSAALAHFVAALDAVLRGIAAEVVFPEFMLSANASNNNFASILEAGSPATKNFEAQQGLFQAPFAEVARKVIQNRVLLGLLPPAATALDVHVTGPQVDIRDRLKMAQVREIEKRNDVLSVETWTEERGDLEYEKEQQRRAEHQDRAGTGSPLQIPDIQPDPGAPPPRNAQNDDTRDRSAVQ